MKTILSTAFTEEFIYTWECPHCKRFNMYNVGEHPLLGREVICESPNCSTTFVITDPDIV